MRFWRRIRILIWTRLIEAVIRRSEEVLNQTPEMLPVLKEAGVVDSGGQGLLQVIEGSIMTRSCGKEVDYDDREQASRWRNTGADKGS